MQSTWALQGVTCDSVAAKLNDPLVNNTLAKAVMDDFRAALNSSGWPEAAKMVVAMRQPCLDSVVSASTHEMMTNSEPCC
jgi:hypothetical protein